MNLKGRLRAALAAFANPQPDPRVAQLHGMVWGLRADVEALMVALQATLVIACMELEKGDAKLRDAMYLEVRREVLAQIEATDMAFEGDPGDDRVEMEEIFRANMLASAKRFLKTDASK